MDGTSRQHGTANVHAGNHPKPRTEQRRQDGRDGRGQDELRGEGVGVGVEVEARGGAGEEEEGAPEGPVYV